MENKKNIAPKDLLSRARELYGRGDLELTASELSVLAESYPEDIRVRFLYAATLLKLDRYADAIPHFEAVLLVEPVNEKASLGLFHSLLKMDQWPEARREARRFRSSGGESMEYRRLFRDIIKASEMGDK